MSRRRYYRRYRNYGYYEHRDPQIQGKIGESEVAWYLSGFNAERYVILNDVLLEKPYAQNNSIPTVQIDHIVVSVFGIFVIETKNYHGTIYGTEQANEWSVYLGGQKHNFANPLRQNYSHTKTLQQLLLSNAANLGIQGADFNIVPIIAFSENADFSKLYVQGADVVYFHDVPNAILKYSVQPILSMQQVINIANFITAKNINTPENMQRHIQSIRESKPEYVNTDNGINLQNGNGLVNNYGDPITIQNPVYQTSTSVYQQPKQQPKRKSKAWIIVLSIVGGLLLTIFTCCSGSCIVGMMGNTNNTGTQNNPIIQNTPVNNSGTKGNTVISSLKDLSAGGTELQKQADAKVQEYINNTSKTYANCIDTLKDPKPVGRCVCYDSASGDNRIYYIYKITQEIEIKDTINLVKFSEERDFYYYVYFPNVSKDDSGKLIYDLNAIKEPTHELPDYAPKRAYDVITYRFSHPGYMFYSDLEAELDELPGLKDYDVDKIKTAVKDDYNITSYPINVGHGSGRNAGGYKDKIGEVYNQYINLYCHSAFTDPICADYHVGSDYSKMYFTYCAYKDSIAKDKKVSVKLIDIDTYEEFFEGDLVLVDASQTAEVDITGHKNIRIQFAQVANGAQYIMLKDVILEK